MHTELNQGLWTRAEQQEFLSKGFRTRRPDEQLCLRVVRPADYDNDLKRGTVEYMADWKNYAMHNVVIPDGTELRNCNFMQAIPNTAAITGLNLRFMDCNLVNCALDPSWVLERCNTAQAWVVDEPAISPLGERITRQRTQYICAHPSELKGDEVPPETVALRREF